MNECPNCNGHGFLVKRERHERVLDYSHLPPYRSVWRLVEGEGFYEPPTDKEAEQDCVDLEPKQCNKCGGWGVILTEKKAMLSP